ncbi:uncharacterized protein LOC133555703 [Nerophis ophidion]|uniref:uncharacterized protein LOC133555703 n=1 Tax=Nerophis ophidion TaxID=159077 RepID=UPI002AE02A65|nr:uncharacterized protein LOC133555703 [Nerophis ophidion]
MRRVKTSHRYPMSMPRRYHRKRNRYSSEVIVSLQLREIVAFASSCVYITAKLSITYPIVLIVLTAAVLKRCLRSAPKRRLHCTPKRCLRCTPKRRLRCALKRRLSSALKRRRPASFQLYFPPRPTQLIYWQLQVDASDSGVGAVLSHRSTSNKRLHPCAFFSRCLTPTERNYDIGNRELLAEVLALQEWRHLVGGFGDTVCGVHRPQESGLYSYCSMAQPKTNKVGVVPSQI